ncbi:MULTISPECIES: thioredoxin domain-containing protein [unclassified Isoptericola]|uniref:DsbA family protein n=1 Tax=unclassified Isoptericola TaxID=2623355 RepID=UPI002712DFD2|nr:MULTISPECIES: thioredoxin domain-containing protein [unclassified Isoptericola]MDO8143900.1 thioredoxin domain-containing protein [Isoptericola sp. 178]MDO8149324.1 thioredoxin domain-containing protein [Isoptericola sp. b515]MDO8152263.1 thioredoxin domain-containing protein [Isoptericola sp. b408]
MSNKQNKSQRRDEARAEALAVQQQQAQRDRRNRMIVFAALGVAIAALVAVAVFILMGEADKKSVEDIPLAEVADVPSTALEGGGIPVGSDLVAGGENEGAPVVDEYLDYMCPVCGQFEEINAADVETMLTEGDATVVFHPVSILDRMSQGTDFSTRSASAAYWVADRAPESFFAFNEALFVNQPAENTEGLSDEEMASIAEEAGVPADVAAGIADGTARGTFGQYVYSLTSEASANPDLANANGGFGTPTILVDGERFETWNQPGALLSAVQGDGAAGADAEGESADE